jgi:CRP/FNR family transcriptional regulator
MKAVEKLFRQHGRPFAASADDTLLVRGKNADPVYFIQSGRVLLHSTSANGRLIGFEIVTSRQVFGFATVASHGRSFLDATALTSCELLVAKLKVFEKALRSSSEATREMLYYMSEQLLRRTRQAEGLALDNLRKRLARWIIVLAREQHGKLDSDNTIWLEINQKIMAAMAGVSRETLNRQLHSWMRSGILAVEGHELRIMKPAALVSLAELVD